MLTFSLKISAGNKSRKRGEYADLLVLRVKIMKRQNGQAAVEFALTLPFIFMVILAIIYGGVMFMDYLNFENQARTIAREIAVAPTKERRDDLVNDYKYGITVSSFYDVTKTVKLDEVNKDVTVVVTFHREKSLPIIDFPPKEFTIKYKMRLEEVEDEI